MKIILTNLPKISLNKWYAGTHWAKRKNIKDLYKISIKSQCDEFFKKENKYDVIYNFYFKNNPLDATNCVAMVKMIEDVLFESDGYKTIKTIVVKSNKDKKERVEIEVLNYE